MKRFLILTAAAMTLVSCGRTVYQQGQNGDIGGNSGVQESTTAPATVPPTEPSTLERPEKLKLDVHRPADYQVRDALELKGFETIMQCPELPTGCEVTALAEVLNYCGFNVDKMELVEKFLPIDVTGTAGFDKAYIGDPTWDDGFGCYAPVIVRTANEYFSYIGSDWYAVDLTGCDMEEIFYQVEQGRPVVVWTTINQAICYPQFYPQVGAMFNGMQHCLAVFGYNKPGKSVHCADPLKGNMAYDLERFTKTFDILGKQAVVLVGHEETAGLNFTDDKQKQAWIKANRPDLLQPKEEQK